MVDWTDYHEALTRSDDCSYYCRSNLSNNLVLMAAVLIGLLGLAALVRAFSTTAPAPIEVEARDR